MATSIARPLLLALPLLLAACAHTPAPQGDRPPRPAAGPTGPVPGEVLAEAAGQTVVLECLITAQGSVERCRVLQGLSAEASAALVQHFETRRYEPAIFEGQAVDVDYTFHIQLEAPTPKPLATSGPSASSP
jgi:hypothetical protein